MSKQEGKLKSQFRAALEDVSGFYMLQLATRGAPDRLIVGNKVYSQWEFKHGTPSISTQADQELMCNRLAVAGYCRYVIWKESGDSRVTLVVHPRAVLDKSLTPEAWCTDFDHRWLVRFVMKVHGL